MELPSSLRFRPPLRSVKGYKLLVIDAIVLHICIIWFTAQSERRLQNLFISTDLLSRCLNCRSCCHYQTIFLTNQIGWFHETQTWKLEIKKNCNNFWINRIQAVIVVNNLYYIFLKTNYLCPPRKSFFLKENYKAGRKLLATIVPGQIRKNS